MATEAQVVAFLRSAGVANVSGRDWRSSCQALMYQLCKKFGSAPVIYPTAHAAYAASKIVSTNPALALPGDFHFFDLNAADHVSLSFGGSRGLMGSSHCPDDAATNAGFMTVEAYTKASGARYLGFARSDGANDIPIEVPVSMTQRTTIAKGANVRSTPVVDPGNLLTPLKGNWNYDIQGWRHGGSANGSTVWFVTQYGYSHSSGFTNPAITGLADLNPVAPPVVVPPVVVPPVTTVGATKAEVQAIVSASETKVLAVIAAIAKPATPPTAVEIAAEVIRQQKLPGN